MHKFFIISGIPASGKSTLGRKLSKSLGLPMLDKDEILEAMFDSLGIGGQHWRQRLSRSADAILKRLSLNLANAIITSWWQHPDSDNGHSGTPTEWLAALNGKVAEIYCICDPVLASKRFIERKRHSGHLDSTRGRDNLVPNFEKMAALGPLKIGSLIEAYTDHRENMDDLFKKIRVLL